MCLLTLASSSPEVSSTSFPTPPPRASGDARLRQPVFRCSAHRLSQTRRAESLRWHSSPCCAGPRRSRGFSSSVAATGFTPTAPRPEWSRLRSRLQSLRLLSVTQAPSAAPAHTSEVRCCCTFILPSVPEPERQSSLASTTIPSGSCRACRLACSLSGRQKERC